MLLHSVGVLTVPGGHEAAEGDRWRAALITPDSLPVPAALALPSCSALTSLRSSLTVPTSAEFSWTIRRWVAAADLVCCSSCCRRPWAVCSSCSICLWQGRHQRRQAGRAGVCSARLPRTSRHPGGKG